MKNRVSITITPEQEAEILDGISAVRAKILAVFTNNLTEDDREDLFKLADRRLAFDQKADNYLHQRPDLHPPALDLAEYDQDGTLIAVADRILAALNALAIPVTDSRMSAGNDRLDVDLEFLHYLKFISRSGTPGAQEVHDDLSASYPAGRRRSAAPALL